MQIANIQDTFSLGTSIFEPKPYVCLNNGKIITDQYYYDAENWYDLKTGNALDMESLEENVKADLEQNVESMNLEIGISMSVLTENLLKEHLQ